MAGGGGNNWDATAEYQGTCVYDLWALNIFVNLRAEVQNVAFGFRIYDETWDFSGNQDASAMVHSAITVGEVAITTRTIDGKVVARHVQPNNNHTENSYEIPYRIETQRSALLDETINVAVHKVDPNGSKTKFMVIFMVASNSPWINPVFATFTGVVCMYENIGVSRDVSWAEHVSTKIVGEKRWITWWVNFNTEWPDYVHISDTFDVDLTLYEDTTTTQLATYSASCDQTIIVENNIDDAINPTEVDLGNGYSACTLLTELTESDGVSKPFLQLRHDGNFIYEGEPVLDGQPTSGAWSTGVNSLAGIQHGGGLLASGETVETVVIVDVLQNIVTKRFVRVNERNPII